MSGDQNTLNDQGACASVSRPTTRMSTPMSRIQSGMAYQTRPSGRPEANERKETERVRLERSAMSREAMVLGPWCFVPGPCLVLSPSLVLGPWSSVRDGRTRNQGPSTKDLLLGRRGSWRGATTPATATSTPAAAAAATERRIRTRVDHQPIEEEVDR